MRSFFIAVSLALFLTSNVPADQLESRNEQVKKVADSNQILRQIAKQLGEMIDRKTKDLKGYRSDFAKFRQEELLLEKQLEAVAKQLAATKSELGKLYRESTELESELQMTAELRELKTVSERLKERNLQLTKQLQKLKNGESDVAATKPPRLDGQITAVRGRGLIEISVGKDDGVEDGMNFEFFRQANYVGRAVVRKIVADLSVAELLKNLQKQEPKVGDKVVHGLE